MNTTTWDNWDNEITYYGIKYKIIDDNDDECNNCRRWQENSTKRANLDINHDDKNSNNTMKTNKATTYADIERCKIIAPWQWWQMKRWGNGQYENEIKNLLLFLPMERWWHWMQQ